MVVHAPVGHVVEEGHIQLLVHASQTLHTAAAGGATA